MPQLKCVATLAGERNLIGSKENGKQFVIGFSIETIVYVAKWALDLITSLHMANTCLIVLDPEKPFTRPEIKGISGTDGANYKVIK